jgi:NADH-quinone oxidoreductase subunit N
MPAWSLEFTVVSLALALLLVEAFVPSMGRRTLGWLGLAGLAAVFAMLFLVQRPAGGYWGFYAVDNLAFFYKGLALVATALVLIISLEYTPVLEKFLEHDAKGQPTGVNEFLTLPLFIGAGLMWMASMTDLIGIFVSLEFVTITFYVMVAFMRRNVASLEAGVKYLILGALSTGFLVYGVAWLFGVTGRTDLSGIHAALATAPKAPALFAMTLVIVGMAFKLGAAPFQIWVPDVYQGAPTPVTAFLSVGSKAAGVAVFTRILECFMGAGALSGTVLAIIGALAGATLLVGNLAAIPQGNFKRLMAYSSIGHAGFILLAFAGTGQITSGPNSGQVAAFYLGTYLLMTMAAFLVMVIVRRETGSDDLKAYDGLGQRNSFLAIILSLSAASLAGVPLTAGFFGKFFALKSAVASQQWGLVAIAIIGAAAGFYYYFKVIRSMYWNPTASTQGGAIAVSQTARITLVILAIFIIVLGFAPKLLMGLL